MQRYNDILTELKKYKRDRQIIIINTLPVNTIYTNTIRIKIYEI